MSAMLWQKTVILAGQEDLISVNLARSVHWSDEKTEKTEGRKLEIVAICTVEKRGTSGSLRVA